MSGHKATRCRFRDVLRREFFRPKSRLRRSLALGHLSGRSASRCGGTDDGLARIISFSKVRRPRCSLGLARALVWQLGDGDVLTACVRSEFFRPKSRLRRSLALGHLSGRSASRCDGTDDSLTGIISLCKDLLRPRGRPRSSLGLARALVGQLGDGGLADRAGEWADAATMLPRVCAFLFCGWKRYRLLAVCSTMGIGQWVLSCMLFVRKSPGYFEAGSALKGRGFVDRRWVYSGHIGIRGVKPLNVRSPLFQGFRFKLCGSAHSTPISSYTRYGNNFTSIDITCGSSGPFYENSGRLRYCSNGRGCSTDKPSRGARYVLLSNGKPARSFDCSAS